MSSGEDTTTATCSTTATPATAAASEDCIDYSNYEKLVRKLYQTNLFNPVKLGLENIKRLHEAIGSPMDKSNLTIIHVAGTNGKGSVALKIAKTIEVSSPEYRVGLFVSPHVSSFRERMQVNSRLISESEVERLLPPIFDLCHSRRIPATFFEITTVLAFSFFASKNANVVVLETGLGGRLDATNIVQRPSLSVITSIGLEHTRILGDTIEKIALEKAGIMKEGCPVLVGPNVPHEVMKRASVDKNCSDYVICAAGEHGEIVDYDVENSNIAISAIQMLQRPSAQRRLPYFISPDHMKEGTSHRPPCRFETTILSNSTTNHEPVQVVLDVAHNPSALRYLLHKLNSTFATTTTTTTTHKRSNTKLRFVVGFSRDKDLSRCARMLLEHDRTQRIHLVEAAHPRAATLEQMLHACPELRRVANYDAEDRSITAQIRRALEEMATSTEEEEQVLVVCGSVFLMAEARQALGYDEPRDSECIQKVAGSGIKPYAQENFGDDNENENDEKGNIS